jgi:hypothetical protein
VGAAGLALATSDSLAATLLSSNLSFNLLVELSLLVPFFIEHELLDLGDPPGEDFIPSFVGMLGFGHSSACGWSWDRTGSGSLQQQGHGPWFDWAAAIGRLLEELNLSLKFFYVFGHFVTLVLGCITMGLAPVHGHTHLFRSIQ